MSARVKSNSLRYAEFAFGVFCLLSGCTLYLLFRSTSIRLYRLFADWGMGDLMENWRSGVSGWTLPDCILFSLPDGLYCASYIMMMHAIWFVRVSSRRYIIVVLIPVIAVIHESLQLLHIMPGTFDILDILAYALPVVIHAVVITRMKMFR